MGYYSHLGYMVYVPVRTASSVFQNLRWGKKETENQISKLPFNEKLLKWFILTKQLSSLKHSELHILSNLGRIYV